ncbi:MAG TPA: GTPase HflX [Firmicutes bacterium]|nr:GTPase HflX [Bacillota bacterium]
MGKNDGGFFVGKDLLREKTVIVGTAEEGNLEELSGLVWSAGGRVVAKLYKRSEKPNPAFFLTEGKLWELKNFLRVEEATLVVFDDELTPVQARNLEEELQVKILDRTGLILDIFALRARTKEAKLQVEKAQLEYLLPRLAGKGVMLSRLAGGIGTRGPGETKLESDRRRIRSKIAVLNRRLKQVKANRQLQRVARKRFDWPILALVGYTNAGKSTLFRFLTGAEVAVEDRLFSTLDPTFRRITFPNQQEALLIDTVGFIRKLPHQLVDSFRATLEEIRAADLLLHVVNMASPQREEEYMAVNALLRELGLEEKPFITVLNKKDLVANEFTIIRAERNFPNALSISAQTGTDVDKLKKKIMEILSARVNRGVFFIPFTESRYLSVFHERGRVYKKEFNSSGVYLDVELPRIWFERLRKFKV